MSTSTIEAEYVALSKAAAYFFWLKAVLNDLRVLKTPRTLCYNNQSAIDLTENYWISELSKHIVIQYHQVWKLVNDKTLLLMYTQTMDN
jgi:hypothetical protein